MRSTTWAVCAALGMLGALGVGGCSCKGGGADSGGGPGDAGGGTDAGGGPSDGGGGPSDGGASGTDAAPPPTMGTIAMTVTADQGAAAGVVVSLGVPFPPGAL